MWDGKIFWMSEFALWCRGECPCYPGFRYYSSFTFDNHFRSKRHQLYEVALAERYRQKVNDLNHRLSQESQRSEKLEKTLFQMRKRHAAAIIVYAARARIARNRLARLQEHNARHDFSQCLRHLIDAHRYRRALRACYSIIMEQ